MLSVFNFSIYSCDQGYSNTSGNSLTESQVFLYVWEHVQERKKCLDMKLGFLHSFIVRRWLGVNSITRATFAFVCIFSACYSA